VVRYQHPVNTGESFHRLTDNAMGIYDFTSCPQAIRFESHRFVGISLLLDGMAAGTPA
jgi:hypothetical protein